MITAKLTRYYGDSYVTKSIFTLLDDKGTNLFECEAREMQYADYGNDDHLPGCSCLCLPRGSFPCKLCTMACNPLCFRVQGVNGHRGAKVYFDAMHEVVPNAVLLGYANKAQKECNRQLIDIENARDAFLQVMYQHFTEEVEMIIENKK